MNNLRGFNARSKSISESILNINKKIESMKKIPKIKDSLSIVKLDAHE